MTTTTNMDYNNDDEWHLHRDALIGLLPSSNDADDDDANNVNAAHHHHHHCPEEILKIVDDNDTSFFDEEDVIGYYVSYNPYDDDMINNDEDEVVDTPATSDSTVVAVASSGFHTPTPSMTAATARRCHHHDSNANRKSKRKRTRRDPNLPKGWLTPVLLYSNANRARVKMENPNVSFGDVVSLVPQCHLIFLFLSHHPCCPFSDTNLPPPVCDHYIFLSSHRPVFSRQNSRIFPQPMRQFGKKRPRRIRRVMIGRWQHTILLHLRLQLFFLFRIIRRRHRRRRFK